MASPFGVWVLLVDDGHDWECTAVKFLDTKRLELAELVDLGIGVVEVIHEDGFHSATLPSKGNTLDTSEGEVDC